LQEPTAQLPELQVGLPFATLHTLPHEPQLPVLVLVFTSQPSEELPLQSA
jgi:hypothetical protein